jgi:ubiquitin carboxyl-terminal hydrolase L5
MQTTNNACATVAMLNIVMNAEGIDLGDKLQAFKESTKDLSTALRGHQISKNRFIRTIHNSFTRRMDHLNADLFLENESSETKSTANKRRSAPKGGKRVPPRKKKADSDYGFHFIAYVPAGGYVWELDGLQYRPCRLGKYTASWNAAPFIVPG